MIKPPLFIDRTPLSPSSIKAYQHHLYRACNSQKYPLQSPQAQNGKGRAGLACGGFWLFGAHGCFIIGGVGDFYSSIRRSRAGGMGATAEIDGGIQERTEAGEIVHVRVCENEFAVMMLLPALVMSTTLSSKIYTLLSIFKVPLSILPLFAGFSWLLLSWQASSAPATFLTASAIRSFHPGLPSSRRS